MRLSQGWQVAWSLLLLPTSAPLPRGAFAMFTRRHPFLRAPKRALDIITRLPAENKTLIRSLFS
jgi:hypothetical protein